MESIFDVLVAGAGPAGSEFAYRMARLGYRVLVLEKGPLNREKPCGGGIQTQEIIEFGPLPDNVVERYIETATVIAPNGGVLKVPKYLEACGATVKRSVYDRWLSHRAEESGALYRDYCRVVAADVHPTGVTLYAETPDERIALKGRLLAIATGYSSPKLVNSLGIPNFIISNYAVATQCWIQFDEDTIDRRIGNTIEIYCGDSVVPQGYAWIFPKREIVAVGLGCTSTVQKRGNTNLRTRLNRFIQHHPIASRKLSGGKVVRKDGGPIPFFVASCLTAPSVLILGDAGGFGNAIHGGGIYQARKSAAIAEPYAQEYIENRTASSLTAYEKAARDHFNEYEGRWDVKMRPFFWEDDLINMTVHQASKGDRQIPHAIGIILNSDQPHKVAYNMLEPRMLDLIHDCLREKTKKYRSLVDASINALFQSDTLVNRAARHILCAKAKRIRASLALIATEAAGGDAEAALPMAIGFELLHTASLIHDDIMDDAKTRRDRQSVHCVYGVNMAITAGDLLIFEAYRQLLSLAAHFRHERVNAVLHIFSNCAAQTCCGQADDLTFDNRNGTVDEYLAMVRKKTGSMIEAPLEGGAALAGATTEWQQKFRDFGYQLGTAFQIVDDAIDYLGSEDKAYKTLGNDLLRKKGSAMMICCRERCNRREQEILSSTIERYQNSGEIEHIKPVLELLYKYNAIGLTQRLCGQYIDQARTSLKNIGKEPARTTLDAIARIVGYWGLLEAKIPDDEKLPSADSSLVNQGQNLPALIRKQSATS